MTNGDLIEKEIIYFGFFLDNASLGGEGGGGGGVSISKGQGAHVD